jgi:hypothetical protein
MHTQMLACMHMLASNEECLAIIVWLWPPTSSLHVLIENSLIQQFVLPFSYSAPSRTILRCFSSFGLCSLSMCTRFWNFLKYILHSSYFFFVFFWIPLYWFYLINTFGKWLNAFSIPLYRNLILSLGIA